MELGQGFSKPPQRREGGLENGLLSVILYTAHVSAQRKTVAVGWAVVGWGGF